MGQNSACCNPTTQMLQPQSLSLPKQAFVVEPITQIPQYIIEPRSQMIDTLKRGEEYLLRRFGRTITVSSDELWRVDVRRSEGKQVVYGRGGSKENGGLSGTSMLFFPSRQIFKGQVQNNRPTFGVFVFRHGCYYAGEMRGFNAEGEGRFENNDTGYSYEGSWAKSLPHGRGTEVYANGDRFEGQLMYGAKFGIGTYHFNSGNIYEGSFYYNQSDGRGKITYLNGNSYEGEWKLGVFEGHGKFQWVNGESYEGQYRQGRRHGFGRYYFKNGSVYQGNWANGVQEGEGMIRDKFDEIRGIWQQGELIN